MFLHRREVGEHYKILHISIPEKCFDPSRTDAPEQVRGNNPFFAKPGVREHSLVVEGGRFHCFQDMLRLFPSFRTPCLFRAAEVVFDLIPRKRARQDYGSGLFAGEELGHLVISLEIRIGVC